MHPDFLRPPSDAERHARYPVRVLVLPSFEPGGVSHGPPAARELLSWGEIAQVGVAEVGEPEGVRTVVYDLVTRTQAGIAVWRLDAEPGEAAMDVARLLSPRSSARAPRRALRVALRPAGTLCPGSARLRRGPPRELDAAD